MLISDVKATRSAVAMTIAAGHFRDPKECPGLSHLLEHCLFSGCKAYPKENQINQYIESYGGHINAWTAAEMTGFHIDCSNDDFVLCNAMLANMLAYPLFPEQAISNEIQAIDSEYHYKQQDEQRRIYQVDKETCNPNHPFSQFSVGNKEVFEQFPVSQVAEMLRQYHGAWYRADNMRLCMLSNESLDEMESKFLPEYHILSKEPTTQNDVAEALYLPQNLAQKIEIKPLKNIHLLTLSFILPDIHQWYRNKPETIISQMLGHEGEGSLLGYFKNRAWATHLAAGGGMQGKDFKDYTVSINLTNQGLKAIPEILNAIFYYIELIKVEGFPAWRFKEKQLLNLLNYEFQDDVKASDQVNHLAIQLHYYPDEHISFGEYVLDDHSPEPARKLIQLMTLENMRIKLVSPTASAEHMTKWYNTPYSLSPIPDDWLNAIQSLTPVKELSLPSVNSYLPEHLSLHPLNLELDSPVRISQHPNGESWYGQDQMFRLPKGEVFVTFACPEFNRDINAAAHTRLWAAAIQEHLNNEFYNAGVAGIYCHLYPHQNGVSLHTSGFADKQLSLVKDILEQLTQTPRIDPYFNQVKLRRIQALKNSLLNKPVNRLFTALNTVMQHNYMPEELTQSVLNSEIEDVQNVGERLFQSHWQSLIYGNWTQNEAEQLDAFIAKHFNNNGAQQCENKILELRELESHFSFVNCQHNDSALVHYIQAPDNSAYDILMCMMLEHILSSSYFDWMRTQKQLGYHLGCGYLPYREHPGLALYIQSPHASADELYLETQRFLSTVPSGIFRINDSGWNKLKENLARMLNANDVNLSMKCQRLWTALETSHQTRSDKQSLTAQVEQLTRSDTAEYLFNLINKNMGTLSLLSVGAKGTPQNLPARELTHLAQFRPQQEKLPQ